MNAAELTHAAHPDRPGPSLVQSRRGRGLMKKRMAIAMASCLLSLVFAPSVSAAYYTGCSTPNNYHEYLNVSSVDMTWAWGQIYNLRATHQCSGSSGISFVLPVNVQGGAFVQIGYVRGGTDTQGYFKFTPSDQSGGNMNGTSANFPSPVYGHSFNFIIWKTTVGGINKWGYTVEDDSTGSTGISFGSRSVSHLTGPLWAGFEVYKSEDAFGGLGGTSWNRITAISWKNSSGVVADLSSWTKYPCCGTKMSYWKTLSGFDANGDIFIDAWTNDH
jgi:hypothetical protein